jgi:hypothetical protein
LLCRIINCKFNYFLKGTKKSLVKDLAVEQSGHEEAFPLISFHPRLIVLNYFTEIIQKINTNTDALLRNKYLSREMRDRLIHARDKQVETVKEILTFNLPQDCQNAQGYAQKWSLLFKNSQLDFKHRISQIREEIISLDCVLLEQPEAVNGLDLWITPSKYKKKSWHFFK